VGEKKSKYLSLKGISSSPQKGRTELKFSHRHPCVDSRVEDLKKRKLEVVVGSFDKNAEEPYTKDSGVSGENHEKGDSKNAGIA